MKQKLFKMAWAIVACYPTFAEALRQAWKVSKLSHRMKHTTVPFIYKKVDGSTRLAAGTLQPEVLPPTKGTGKVNAGVLTYYDAEVKQWRSCKIENIIFN